MAYGRSSRAGRSRSRTSSRAGRSHNRTVRRSAKRVVRGGRAKAAGGRSVRIVIEHVGLNHAARPQVASSTAKPMSKAKF